MKTHIKNQKRLFSRYTVLAAADPDIDYGRFYTLTGGSKNSFLDAKKWSTGRTFKDLGVQPKRTLGVLYIIANPTCTKEQFVKAGFKEAHYHVYRAQARSYLVRLNVSPGYINLLNSTLERNTQGMSRPSGKVSAKKMTVPKEKPVDGGNLVEKLAKVLADKDAEITLYKNKCALACAENERLKKEVKELTEMINGVAV